MKNKIVVAVALLVIVGVTYWAIDMVRPRTYSGANIAFDVGGGYVVVRNLGNDPIPVEMRTSGRSATFRVESPELELKQSSSRQGSGTTAYHGLAFDLPSGQAKIDVTRGSGVQFVSTSSTPIQAVVTPLESGGVRTTLLFAGAVILVALYYISRTTEHRWVSALRDRLTRRSLPSDATT